ncbi:hypothetical protein [Bacillus cereus]|uniref:hypothetical protein n=1 Tax=Bacillus cereus TaxID=1396 RepID=UPI000BF8A1B7|nr:hypothetical protein [Bacillus cereus]PER69577.1 hypothetical protein CN502_09670 [Bacillus cereus]PGL36008.1 hypothetical protein CN913_20395 [Bacillus cereus]
MIDNHEVVTAIQQKTALEIDEKLGIDLDKHWENYEIQLSEDNRVIEEIHPDMRLSLGEMLSVVNRCGTEKEMDNFNQIADYLEPYYEAELIQEEFYDMPIAKVTTDRQQNMKVECLSEYVSDSDIEFDFNHSILEAVNHINHSIANSHKEVMNGDVAYIEEKKVEDGDIRFNPVEEIVNDRKTETEEVFQMESAKTVSSVMKGHGAIVVQESKTTPEVAKRYVGKDTVHGEEQQQISQTREQARRHYMMKHMLGRDY